MLALAHHFPGAVLVVVERAAECSVEQLCGWLLDTYFTPRLPGSPVALVTVFSPRPKEPWWPAAYPEVEGVGDRLFAVCFVDDDPRACWDSHFAGLGDALAASGTGRLLLAAPFIPCAVGTNDYVDELWP